MAYRVRHVCTRYDASIHETKVQEALDQIGEGEIYSVEHSLAWNESYNSIEFSTLVVYRIYED